MMEISMSPQPAKLAMSMAVDAADMLMYMAMRVGE